MITGETLIFNQEDIIKAQQERRQKSHPSLNTPEPEFKNGDIVFCNAEGSKLKARDKLVVREKLENGIYYLDRIHQNSGRVTKAYLPARELYQPKNMPSINKRK